ncbi:hypothetical protein EC991_005938 [Linnemannia zychae]|nr:hypothetical protein EC991_005938 [Linnemannia zychae]
MRNRNASCPDIHKTVGGNYHKIDASTYKTDSTEYDDKGSGGVATMEGEEEKPITTTIYYHPPSPRDAVTETPSTGFSVASTAIKSQHQQQQKQSLSIPSSLVESRHELWYLRHIGRIPAASTSTPELNSLPQQLPSQSTPNNPSADTTDPILLASLPLSPAPSNVFKASSQESLCTAPPPSHIFTPMAFQTRRSSANYSKDDIIKKNKNYEKKHAQLTPHRAIPVPATPVPSRTNSSSCHPLYSVETLKRLRDSIRDMAEFAPSSSSPVPDSVMPPRTEVLPVSDNSSDIISASIASVNGAWCPHNSPIISSDIEFPTSTACYLFHRHHTLSISEQKCLKKPVDRVIGTGDPCYSSPQRSDDI